MGGDENGGILLEIFEDGVEDIVPGRRVNAADRLIQQVEAGAAGHHQHQLHLFLGAFAHRFQPVIQGDVQVRQHLLGALEIEVAVKVVEEADNILDVNSNFLKIRSLVNLGKVKEAYREYRINEIELLSAKFEAALDLYVLIGEKLNLPYRTILVYLESVSSYAFLKAKDYGYLDDFTIEYKLSIQNKIFIVNHENYLEGLESDDPNVIYECIIFAKDELSEDEIEEKFLPKVKSLLKDRLVFNLIYALLFDCLVELQDNDEYLFIRDGKYFNFTPAELLFSKQYYEDFLENEVILELSNLAEDECILDYELDLYLSIYPMLMPDYLENKTELDSLIYTIYELASKFYKRSYDKIEDFKLNHVDAAYVDYYKKLIIETCKEWHKFDVYDVN